MYKILFHVDESEKINLTLKNAKNVINDLGDNNVQISIVTNSRGIQMMLKEPGNFETQVRELFSKNVTFSVCQNAMNEMGLQKDAFLDISIIVPSGVGEIVKKQADGYYYVKP